MNLGPAESQLIAKVLEAVIMGIIGYIVRVVAKVIESVSSIPKIRQDLDNLYSRLRALESKNEQKP